MYQYLSICCTVIVQPYELMHCKVVFWPGRSIASRAVLQPRGHIYLGKYATLQSGLIYIIYISAIDLPIIYILSILHINLHCMYIKIFICVHVCSIIIYTYMCYIAV